MKSMIHVGADVEQVKKVLPELTSSILKILASGAGDNVKMKALDMLSGAYEVKNCSISNCSLSNVEAKK